MIKKILVSIILATTLVSQVDAQDLMCNGSASTNLIPEFNAVYFNDSLNIKSIKLYGNYGPDSIVAQSLFNTEVVEKTLDNIYFDLHREYYKLYIPEIKTLFTVSQMEGKHIPVSNHIVWFIQCIRKYRQNNRY